MIAKDPIKGVKPSPTELTMPALMQELNLARRACWRTGLKKSRGKIEEDRDQVSLDKGANNNCLRQSEISYTEINCDSSMFPNCPISSQLCDLYRCKELCFLYLSKWTELFTTRRQQRPNKSKISSVNSAKFSVTNCSLLILISCILMCIVNTEARPNQSVVSNAVAENTEGTESVRQGVSPSLAATFPITSIGLVQQDRQNVPSNDISPDTVHEVQSRNSHGDSYPVFMVEFDRVKTPFIIGIWILFASIAKIGFHMTPKLNRIFPESCLLIVVGVIIGVILYFGTAVEVSPLTPNTFFFYMLPPIILDAGYFMPNRLFFDNLGTILLMAVIGTIFNIATIGGSLWACGLTGVFNTDTPFLDVFLFSSLISAVDPVAVLAVFEEIHVNEILYIVVFGESLLNDAVTVVLYHMMEAYKEIGGNNIKVSDVCSGVASFFVVAVGGTFIGVIWGFLTGLVTRFTDHVRVIEPIFIFVMAYLAYLNAEIFHMSGILAITFCGITMKNYVESNISQKSHTTVKYALKMLSSSSETIIFMFLGLATVHNRHEWNTAFVALTIIFCSVYRIFGVILLTFMANRFRLHKLSRVDQFVMSYGGLRGAVAFALALLIDDGMALKSMFVTTTIAVIYFTVFIQGITIKPLVKFLNVKRASKRKPTMNERIHERFMDHLMAGVEDIVGKTGNFNVRDKFKRFDNRFIRPLLIRDLKVPYGTFYGRRFFADIPKYFIDLKYKELVASQQVDLFEGAEPKIIETYSKLTMRDAMEVMRRNPSTIGQMSGTESMSALFRNYTTNYLGGGRCAPPMFNTCPSLTNLETCSRNLDMHELDYNPSKKDLTDARIHHLLAEELKPYKRHRRLSYSRHAVDDRDLSTQVNYKMHMNIRRMVNDRDRKHHKRSKRGGNKQDGIKTNHVSFHDFQQNGSSKQLSNDYINGVLNESAEEPQKSQGGSQQNEDWDDGLTFTAKSSPDSDRANNNSLIAHITSLPGFDASKARIVKHYTSRGGSPEKTISPDIGPTAAELILPWRRDRSYQNFVGETAVILEEDRSILPDSDGERRVATPTATESQLPWKRNEDGTEDGGAIKQNEFPAWASNKEYLAYNSPSATFLGGLSKPKQAKSVIGLFRRESSGSGADGIGSDPALAAALSAALPLPLPTTPVGRQDKRSASIAGSLIDSHSGPFPITASHRRNTRRGSMLELTGNIIPEENNHHSKSMSEKDEWTDDTNKPGINLTAAASIDKPGRGSGREPLLPKLTPKAQIRRQGNTSQVTTALLSSSNSTSDSDDDDDEEEDFDVYDDDHIVNTSISNRRGGARDRNDERI